MSEEFGEFVKWVVIGVVVISVYNLVTERRQGVNYSQNISAPKSYKTTIIIDDQTSATFRNW